jgi:shikimate dehydrogenase
MNNKLPTYAGVMGWPVEHSRSPLIHNHWLKKHGIAGEYVALAVSPEALEKELRGLAAKNFKGCNITVPHKEEALKIMDETDDLAKRVGAVNTVVVAGGKLRGSNSDVYGFIKNLETVGSAWKKKKPAVVIGAGGAARAVIVGLAESGCSDIRLVNRTADRAIELAREMNERLGKKKAVVQPVGWPDRHDVMEGAYLLVNTTTQGMQGENPLDVSLRELPEGALVTDLVYVPLITPLLAQARGNGHKIVDGLGMLLHQAVPGFEAWFGVKPQVDADVRGVVEKSLATI